MFSPLCPDCGGAGFVVMHNFSLPCKVCLANVAGNKHLTDKDLKNRAYMEQWAKAERFPYYWFWLKAMVADNKIDLGQPKSKRVRKKK